MIRTALVAVAATLATLAIARALRASWEAASAVVDLGRALPRKLRGFD